MTVRQSIITSRTFHEIMCEWRGAESTDCETAVMKKMITWRAAEPSHQSPWWNHIRCSCRRSVKSPLHFWGMRASEPLWVIMMMSGSISVDKVRGGIFSCLEVWILNVSLKFKDFERKLERDKFESQWSRCLRCGRCFWTMFLLWIYFCFIFSGIVSF